MGLFSIDSYRSHFCKPIRPQSPHYVPPKPYERSGSDMWVLEIEPTPRKKPKRKRVSPQKAKPVETKPVETKPDELPESEVDVERFKNLETEGDK